MLVTSNNAPRLREPLSTLPGPTHVVNGLQVSIHSGNAHLVSALMDEWTELCQEGPSNQTFFTPVFLDAWLRAFAPQKPLLFITARDKGKLRGVLPLMRQSPNVGNRLFRHLRAPSNFYSGRSDLVHGEGDSDMVSQAIWKALNDHVAWDVIEFRDVAEGGAFDVLVGQAQADSNPVITRDTVRSPYIAFDQDDDLTTFGPLSRMKRSGKSLAKLGNIQLHRISPADAPSLERFFRLEAAGWKGEAGTAIASDPAAVAFYTEFATNVRPGFIPSIYELELDGTVIAAELGTETDDMYFNHKRAYDEDYRRHGPGHILMREVLLDLGKRGKSQFDLLGNDEPYKLEWTSLIRHHHHYIIFRNSLKGRTLHKVVNLAYPIAKKAKLQLDQARQFRPSMPSLLKRDRAMPRG